MKPQGKGLGLTDLEKIVKQCWSENLSIYSYAKMRLTNSIGKYDLITGKHLKHIFETG